MSQIPKEEILGYHVPDCSDFICLNCAQTAIKNESSILSLHNLQLKDDLDEDYIYFCDQCSKEIRPFDREKPKTKS